MTHTSHFTMKSAAETVPIIEGLHILYLIDQSHHASRHVNTWIDTKHAPALTGVTTSLCYLGPNRLWENEQA